MIADFSTETQPSKRERVKALIRALLAKTLANGATEGEALAAAAKASELMAQYDLTFEDAQAVRDEAIGKSGKAYGRTSRLHEATDTWDAICDFATVKCYFIGPEIVFFGQRQDVEVAHYLMDLFINCANVEWQAFRRRGRGAATDIRGRKAFMRGFVYRLKARLREMRRARDAHSQAATGNALVVLKGQLVTQRYNQHEAAIGLRALRSTRIAISNDGNYQAGQAAGSRVNITTGVGGDSGKRIGRA